MFFVLLVLASNNANWVFNETGVFQPLGAEEVRVSEHGIYIVNFAESRIIHLDHDGTQLKDIGAKGRGPGEFTYPMYLFVDRKGVFVADALTNAMSQFTHDGSFVKRVNLPGRNLALARTSSGWLYGTWEDSHEGQEPALYIADDAFEEIRQIKLIQDPGFASGMRVEMGPEGVQAVYAPVSTSPIMCVSLDGKTAYLNEGDRFQIHVIDTAKGEVIQTLTRTEPRIPFDTDWADERFAQIQERMPSQQQNISFDKAYPDYFPVVREMAFSPDNQLVVNRWMGKPDDRDHAICLDAAGQEIPLTWSWSNISRYCGSYDGYAYVTVFNQEREEAGVAKIPLEKAQLFLTDNPIVFEGTAGRTISISN